MKKVLALTLLTLGATACVEGEQTEACRQYISCMEALDAAQGHTTNVERFEADGACWGSPEGAELCDRACNRGLIWIDERITDAPAACAAE